MDGRTRGHRVAQVRSSGSAAVTTRMRTARTGATRMRERKREMAGTVGAAARCHLALLPNIPIPITIPMSGVGASKRRMCGLVAAAAVAADGRVLAVVPWSRCTLCVWYAVCLTSSPATSLTSRRPSPMRSSPGRRQAEARLAGPTGTCHQCMTNRTQSPWYVRHGLLAFPYYISRRMEDLCATLQISPDTNGSLQPSSSTGQP